jgi:hypothetical protein
MFALLRFAKSIPELFNSNESKRAEKMLELAYPKFFQAWMRVKGH